MAIDLPQSDLSRSKQHEPDHAWPSAVKIQIQWKDEVGRVTVRSHEISADAFFGTGPHGAPLDGSALIQMIEIMRRAGPPKFVRGGKK